ERRDVGCLFFQAEDGIRGPLVTGVQTCALPICGEADRRMAGEWNPDGEDGSSREHPGDPQSIGHGGRQQQEPAAGSGSWRTDLRSEERRVRERVYTAVGAG